MLKMTKGTIEITETRTAFRAELKLKGVNEIPIIYGVVPVKNVEGNEYIFFFAQGQYAAASDADVRGDANFADVKDLAYVKTLVRVKNGWIRQYSGTGLEFKEALSSGRESKLKEICGVDPKGN